MASKRKSWQEKLHIDRKPQVEKLQKDYSGMKKGQLMLIPTPTVVDGYIKSIPKGKTASLNDIRNDLAREFRADFTCPLTTGIFLRIVAEAAWEEHTNGKPVSDITPFWRVINEKMPVAKKLSFGIPVLNELRSNEGL